jgi:hypothetical protein
MYKLIAKFNQIVGAYKDEPNMRVSFLFDLANTDYQTFKKEVLAGAELQDDTGNVMTQANAFIASLP